MLQLFKPLDLSAVGGRVFYILGSFTMYFLDIRFDL